MNCINGIVGQRIRRLRCDHGLKAKALAKLLGISQQQVSRYERGINKIDASIIFKVINIFGVPYESLFPDPEMEDFTQTKNSGLLQIINQAAFNSTVIDISRKNSLS
ncbi:helix-turn-helix domain-containing protein [Morganella morganii]|uniref:helix-turn-helix domain-containing protein n=1 Tax=Morganella morganii TaxID=582 RepID=UPI0021D0B310|nr:helix-turn-helix transcriptional regulator [Morganella morganii]MCU6237390.1 helix-turn-helix domain-containing protein [Morganella morganii]